MSFVDGWDRRDLWTLRFADPELERSYQHADEVEGIRRVRTASLLAIVVWVLVAAVGPSALGTRPGPVWVTSAIMITILLTSAGLSHWATTLRRRDAIGLGQQLAAGVATLVLVSVTGTFETYAMPGIMLTAVVGFTLTRHPFAGEVGLGIFYCTLFLLFALALGLGTALPLQLLLVSTTVVCGCVGAYLLERSQRTAYAQSRLVNALHDRVDQLLHQYLSPDVASALIEDPGRAALGGVELEITVLFADLRGYTTYAERRAPAEVVTMLNAAFEAAVPAILAEGGAVIQFMGDAVMAIFNAPRPQPDHALRAARAALAMQRSVRDLPAAGGRPQFRIGLNTGVALVGNIGAARMHTFSAVGDTINLAARLQTYATEGTVVIGARTYEHIRAEAVVRSLGVPSLKGKSDPVEVYELIRLRATDDDRETAMSLP